MSGKKKYKGIANIPFNVGKTKDGFKQSYKKGDPYETTCEKTFDYLVQTKRIKENK